MKLLPLHSRAPGARPVNATLPARPGRFWNPPTAVAYEPPAADAPEYTPGWVFTLDYFLVVVLALMGLLLLSVPLWGWARRVF